MVSFRFSRHGGETEGGTGPRRVVLWFRARGCVALAGALRVCARRAKGCGARGLLGLCVLSSLGVVWWAVEAGEEWALPVEEAVDHDCALCKKQLRYAIS